MTTAPRTRHERQGQTYRSNTTRKRQTNLGTSTAERHATKSAGRIAPARPSVRISYMARQRTGQKEQPRTSAVREKRQRQQGKQGGRQQAKQRHRPQANHVWGRQQTVCEAASRPCAWTAGPGPPEASQRRPLSSNRLELNLFSTHLYYLENLRESCVLRLRREIEESDFCDEAARDGLTGRSHGSYEIGATPHIITVNRAKAFLEAGQDESVEQGVLKADVYRWRRAAKRRKYRRSKNPKRETTGIQPQKWKWSRRTKWSESWLAERTEDESWNARTRRSI